MINCLLYEIKNKQYMYVCTYIILSIQLNFGNAD